MIPVSLLTLKALGDVGHALPGASREANAEWFKLTGDGAVLGDALLGETRGRFPIWPSATPHAPVGSNLHKWFRYAIPDEVLGTITQSDNGIYSTTGHLGGETSPRHFNGTYSFNVHRLFQDQTERLSNRCKVLFLLNRYGCLPPCP